MASGLRGEGMQGRTQRIGGEVQLPQTRREFSDFARRMNADPLQYIDQVGIGVDAMKAARDDQTLHDAHVFGAELGPAEVPILASHGNHTQSALQMIGVQRQARIAEEQLEPSAAFVRIGQVPTGWTLITV